MAQGRNCRKGPDGIILGDMKPEDRKNTDNVWFDVILHPHRSLSGRGFLIVMIIVGAISFTAGTAFILMGAWPVFGFFGLDALAIYWAFRLNYRSGEVAETIRLTDNELVVSRLRRGDAVGRWRFQPYWVRVVVEELRPEDNRLLLTSHGRQLPVGGFLTADERRSLAAALTDALQRQRVARQHS